MVRALGLIPALLYLAAACSVINDYGITTDEAVNFGMGHKYLSFYDTGKLNLLDNSPAIPGHPDFYRGFSSERLTGVWPLANMLSAATCRVFYSGLGWLQPIPAHHMASVLLTALFLYFLFVFTAGHFGIFTGFVSVFALAVYPSFFGHSFNNIKDIPELVLFSFTLFLFAEYVSGRRLRYLYAAFAVWGLALATKMDAVLVPPIILLWLAPGAFNSWKSGTLTFDKRLAAHLFAGGTVTAAVFILVFPPLMPFLYHSPSEYFHGAFAWLSDMFRYTREIGTNSSSGWNLYAPLQIIYVTPALILVLFAAGLAEAWRKIRENRIYSLMLIWLAVIVLRHCLPGTNHYDGIRHFLMFIVPFSVICAAGVIRRKIILAAALVLPGAFWLVVYHPYQTTYFNMLVGGLRGAQELRLPSSSDYWLNFSREAGLWINRNAVKGACYNTLHTTSVLSYYIHRPDLREVPKDNAAELLSIPNQYWILRGGSDRIPAHLHWMFEKKHEVKRMGGVIFGIYYLPAERVKSREHAQLGFAFLKRNQYGRAIREFEKAKTYFGDYLAVHQGLAQAYYYVKNKKKATEELQEVLKYDPDNINLKNNITGL